MATFVYDAIDPVGRSVKGRISADSENLVLSKLHDQRFHVLSVKEQKGSLSIGGSKSGAAPKLQSLVVFSRQFATMIDAGIPVMKCMDILEQQLKDLPLKSAVNAI